MRVVRVLALLPKLMFFGWAIFATVGIHQIYDCSSFSATTFPFPFSFYVNWFLIVCERWDKARYCIPRAVLALCYSIPNGVPRHRDRSHISPKKAASPILITTQPSHIESLPKYSQTVKNHSISFQISSTSNPIVIGAMPAHSKPTCDGSLSRVVIFRLQRRLCLPTDSRSTWNIFALLCFNSGYLFSLDLCFSRMFIHCGITSCSCRRGGVVWCSLHSSQPNHAPLSFDNNFHSFHRRSFTTISR